MDNYTLTLSLLDIWDTAFLHRIKILTFLIFNFYSIAAVWKFAYLIQQFYTWLTDRLLNEYMGSIPTHFFSASGTDWWLIDMIPCISASKRHRDKSYKDFY